MKMTDTEKQKILDGFIKVCKEGTSKDCRIFVAEARDKGITYDELVAYKRSKEAAI